MEVPIRRKIDIDSIPDANGFGAARKFDHHTGIDLFAPDGTDVFAMETGVVISITAFTGTYIGMPWWNDTVCVAIEGGSGVIVYCELYGVDPDFRMERQFVRLPLEKKLEGVPEKYHEVIKSLCTPERLEKRILEISSSEQENGLKVKVGDLVSQGQLIGKVKRVLTKDKGLPMSMLHLELYDKGYRGDWAIWELNKPRPKGLQSIERILRVVYHGYEQIKIGALLLDGSKGVWEVDSVNLQSNSETWYVGVHPPGENITRLNHRTFVYNSKEFEKLKPITPAEYKKLHTKKREPNLILRLIDKLVELINFR